MATKSRFDGLKPAPNKAVREMDVVKPAKLEPEGINEGINVGEVIKLDGLNTHKKAKLLPDPAEIAELAETGLSKAHIAEGLGVSYSTLRRRLEDTPELLAAYKKGLFAYRKDVLARYKKYAGNTMPGLIFEAKNALGWTDREPVIGSGEPLKIIVSHVVLDDKRDEPIDITPE